MVSVVSSSNEPEPAIGRVPKQFREFSDIMAQEAASKVPNHSPYDHAVDIKEGESPPWGPIYALDETELKKLHKWLENMSEAGAMRLSRS